MEPPGGKASRRMKPYCMQNPVPTAMIDRWNNPRQSSQQLLFLSPMICHQPSFVHPNFASSEVSQPVGSGFSALQRGRALLRAELIPGGWPLLRALLFESEPSPPICLPTRGDGGAAFACLPRLGPPMSLPLCQPNGPSCRQRGSSHDR